jgi:hypothetical protein
MNDEIPMARLDDIPVTRLDSIPIRVLDDIQSEMGPNAMVNRVFMMDAERRNA